MDSSSPPPPANSSRPTHIPLPPPPAFSSFLSTPSPSQRDDPFAEDVHSPFLQFYTAPSTPYSEGDSPHPSSPGLADYFTPPSSPFVEVPVSDSPSPAYTDTYPAPTAQVPSTPLSPPAPGSFVTHPPNAYISPGPYGTDDIYPGIPVDIVNDLILDDGSLTALEKIYLFCRSKQVIHRSFIVKNMPQLLHEVSPQEAVEYVLPLFRELVLDPDESVQEEFSRALGDVMWWFLTHCQVVDDCHDEEGDDNNLQPAQIHYQTFTPLFGTLILSSNGGVSETARCSITTVLERIKKVDDKDALARGHQVRPPLPPENLWKSPVQDYAMDDPEVKEEEVNVGVFGPEERTRVKHEILAAVIVALGRLDSLWKNNGNGVQDGLMTTGPNVDERRSLLQAQNGDGVQVVSPDEPIHENGVTPPIILEASPANVITKEDAVNSYFPTVPTAFSTPSSTPSTSSTSSSSGSSPRVHVAGVSPSSLLDASPNLNQSGAGTPSFSHPFLIHTSENERPRQATHDGDSAASTSRNPASQYPLPAFLRPRRLSQPKGPLAYQLNLGNMVHEEEENIFYDEQVTNGRWSTMRLIAAVASNGTADLDAEIYFINDVNRSVRDPVFWVRREAAFAIGALARVVPLEFVIRDLVPMFVHLVGDPHPDVRQNILFSLPPLAQRLPFEQRRNLTFEALTALSQDPEITVRESALDTLSETIYAFMDDPQGPPEFLLHMYLGREEDKIVRNGTRLITFDVPPPLEAFYLDTKRPLTLAFGFPAVTLTLGKDRWDELRGAYLDLAANRMNDVKRSLAAGLGEIAKVIGPENTRRDLVPVWWTAINCKDSATRIRAIENLDTLASVVGKEQGLSFWEGVMNNWENKVFRVWRERKIILQELIKVAEQFGQEFLPIVKVIETEALADPEQGVRDIAIDHLPRIFDLLSPCQDIFDDFNAAIHGLLSSTFRRRMTYASCQRSLFLASVNSGRKPSIALTDAMLHAISDLSKDTVTDVRISVARFVGSVCDKYMRESESVPDLLVEIVERLSRDTSLSVKSFVPELTTLLTGHPVTFPSSSDADQRSADLPGRSRHFSKPPFPRGGSSPSGLSAGFSWR